MAADDTPRSSIRQQAVASKKLSDYLGDLLQGQSAAAHLRSYVLLTWLWTLGVVSLVALLWAVLPDRFETELQRGSQDSAYSRIANYVLTAFNGYCIPMIVALAIRDGGRQSLRWKNLWRSHWTARLPQAALVVFASWAAATLFVIGLDLWQAAIEVGWAEIERNVWSVLRFSFEYNSPTPFRGAVLALIMVTLLDARNSRSASLSFHPTWLSSLVWATAAGIVMGIVGGITRYLTALSAMNATPTRESLDAIDRGLIVYAALFAAVIGFFVAFCIAEMLRNQGRSSDRVKSNRNLTRGQEG